MATVPVGLNVWSRLVEAPFPYFDRTVAPFDSICNSFRNPAHTAKMIATAQALSGGRAILGIGAGWNEEEYRAYGWPFPPTPVRIARMVTAATPMRALELGESK